MAILKKSMFSTGRMAIAALLFPFLIGLSGCGNDDDHEVTVEAALSAKQQVPAINDSNAGGTLNITVDKESGAISGHAEGSDLSGAISAAHIHSAKAGQNGGIIIELVQDTTNANRFNVPEGSKLNAEQLALFKNGGLYVNVHTAQNPGGEVRGQILPAGYHLVLAQLSGENEVPEPVVTDASGTAYITYHDEQARAVTINVRTKDLDDASAAHLHQAFAGKNGAIIVHLEKDATEMTLWRAEETLTSEQYAALLNGQTYINVHSLSNGLGELRGQAAPDNIHVARAELNGGQEVPPVVTNASGVGYSTVNQSNGNLYAIIRTTGVNAATMAHVHQAALGSNGDVVVDLAKDANDVTLWETADNATLKEDAIDAFKQVNLYFNVHTPATPSGEIRGQLIPISADDSDIVIPLVVAGDN